MHIKRISFDINFNCKFPRLRCSETSKVVVNSPLAMPTKMSLRFRKMLCKYTCQSLRDVNLKKEEKGNRNEYKITKVSIAESSQFAFSYYLYTKAAGRRMERRGRKKFPIKECSMQKRFVFRANRASERASALSETTSASLYQRKPSQRNINILMFSCDLEDVFWFFKDAGLMERVLLNFLLDFAFVLPTWGEKAKLKLFQ